MVVGAFPAAKLGILALKQISKPIANVIKNRAKQSPYFSKYVCKPPAQLYNWIEVKTKMWALNLGKPVKVPQLNEAMAIELGANLLGEFIIFFIGSALLVFEYRRSSNKETAKEEAIAQEKRETQNRLNDLAFNLAKQEAQLRELTRTVAELESKSWFRVKQTSIKKMENVDPESKEIANLNNSKTTYSGNFYSDHDNLLFRALNLIENEHFYSEIKIDDEIEYGLVTKAITYLLNS